MEPDSTSTDIMQKERVLFDDVEKDDVEIEDDVIEDDFPKPVEGGERKIES